VCPDTGEQHVGREGLGDVVVGSGVEADDDVDLGIAGRDEQDREVSVLVLPS